MNNRIIGSLVLIAALLCAQSPRIFASTFYRDRVVASPNTINPQALVHADGGTAASASILFTASASTGQETTDGFRVGLDTSQSGEINMQEAQPIKFYSSGIERARLLSTGELMVGDNFGLQNASVLRARKTYNDPVSTAYGFTADPQFSSTASTDAQAHAAAIFSPNILATNTQDWTGSSGYSGIRITSSIAAGATGVLGTMTSMLQTASFAGMNMTNYRGNRVTSPTVTAPATLTNATGIGIDEFISGTNNTGLLVGGASNAVGNWGLYNTSSYNNYTKSYTGFNNTTPRAAVDIMASASIVGTSEPLVVSGARVANITGDLVGGIALRSNDSNLTAPGVIVATISAIAEATHTASVLTTGLGFGVTNTLYNRETLHLAANGNAGFNMSGAAAPQNIIEAMGGSGNSFAQFVASSTGVTATDGFLVGLTASGSSVLKSQDNMDLSIVMGTNKAMTVQPNGSIAFASSSAVETMTLNGSMNIIASHSGVTGTVNGLAIASSSNVRLDAGITTLNGIQNGTDGKVLYLHNGSGAAVTITNNSASANAVDKILTGTAANVTMAINAVLEFIYDGTSKVWRINAGNGGSGSASTTYYYSQSTFGTDCAFTTVNQTSLTQWTADSSCTFTENLASGLTVTAATSAGNKYGGVTVASWPATRVYRVSACWNYEASVGGATNITYAIHDGSSVVGAVSPVDPTGNNVNATCITRLYSATAAASTTFSPQAISGAANTLTVEGINTSTMVWIIEAANP